jgi:carnitine O-acetyltransferase
MNVIQPASLPVPALHDTMSQYLAALRPVLTPQEFAVAETEAKTFVSRDGKRLQERLLLCAAGLEGHSWLMNYSRRRFLNLRGPLAVIGNFTLEFIKPSWTTGLTQPEIIARLAWGIGRLYSNLAEGRVPAPESASPTLPEDQLNQVLGSSRIPRAEMDDYRVYRPFSEAKQFGLFFRNHYYLIDLFDREGNLSGYSSLLAVVRDIAAEDLPAQPVGFHTAGFAGSEICAAFLNELAKKDNHRRNLLLVERAIFHIAFDERSRSTCSFNDLLYTDTSNLWLYKPWNFTVYRDGAISVNNEHTASDGLSNIWLYEHLFTDLERNTPSDSGGLAAWERLDFHLNENQRQELLDIRAAYLEHTSPFRYEEFHCECVDWDWFRDQGIGRDALIQAGFAFAAYQFYGFFPFIHESVSTAHFREGRTSCLRSVTPESVDLVMAARQGKITPQKLILILRQVSNAHSRLIKQAKHNICFIRHSAGLLDMYQRFGPEIGVHEMPPIFHSPFYRRYCAQEVSTSTLGARFVVARFAFAPTVEAGLGIGYLSGENFFRAFVTWHQQQLPQGERFVRYLEQYYHLLNRVYGIAV